MRGTLIHEHRRVQEMVSEKGKSRCGIIDNEKIRKLLQQQQTVEKSLEQKYVTEVLIVRRKQKENKRRPL